MWRTREKINLNFRESYNHCRAHFHKTYVRSITFEENSCNEFHENPTSGLVSGTWQQTEGYSDGQTDGCYERPTIPEHAKCNSTIL
jgi:hypothetical protein